jgi:DMSO/TMAO reductase YedYZ molybdopterin-dependent catalytic subunit
MGIFSTGFTGRRRADADNPRVPPGQYLTDDFPVLSAGPTPRVPTDSWELTITTEVGDVHRWDWAALHSLDADEFVADLHCVTRWSKLDTPWSGVSLDTLLADVETDAEHVAVRSYGGYTTNLPLADILDGKAWVAFAYDGQPLAPVHGGPARLLVPHLYLWKSAKWVQALTLTRDDEPGFWETAGYHNYGDPWQEQRYWDD